MGKLIKINYYDELQKDRIHDLVLKERNCVKFFSRVLGCEIYIAPDPEEAEALVTALKMDGRQIYLPEELKIIVNHSPKELVEHHANKRGYGNTGRSREDSDSILPTHTEGSSPDSMA